MYSENADFGEHLAVLAVLLMRAHGNKVVVTQAEIYAAREFMRDNDIQMVTYDESKLFGDVAIEFRHKSRTTLKGEVV